MKRNSLLYKMKDEAGRVRPEMRDYLDGYNHVFRGEKADYSICDIQAKERGDCLINEVRFECRANIARKYIVIMGYRRDILDYVSLLR